MCEVQGYNRAIRNDIVLASLDKKYCPACKKKRTLKIVKRKLFGVTKLECDCGFKCRLRYTFSGPLQGHDLEWHNWDGEKI